MVTLHPSEQEVLAWLLESRDQRVAALLDSADAVRAATHGDEVHLRGLIEISNHCERQCLYCGLRRGHRALRRYRLSHGEVLAAVGRVAERGYGTVVLQAGEDDRLTVDAVASLVEGIKRRFALAVTLSLGERPVEHLQAWRSAGADCYLLRFETSSPTLLRQLRPGTAPTPAHPRVAMLQTLRELGYEVGSGMMVGVPGQSYASLARDLMLLRTLDLDMIGVGPYIPHPATPLAAQGTDTHGTATAASQTPATLSMALRAMALARRLQPQANIPATTAMMASSADGLVRALAAGANVIMPRMTPGDRAAAYELYPGKTATHEALSHSHIVALLHTMGRRVGTGPGSRRVGL